jgi:surface antigen
MLSILITLSFNPICQSKPQQHEEETKVEVIQEVKTKVETKIEVPEQRVVEPREVARISDYNGYAYGYCTYFAKQQRPDLPDNLGNAGSWFYNAQAMGLPTGQVPIVGSVVVTNEGYVGHVAIVTQVNPFSFNVREMNYSGWNTISTREIENNSSVIVGFIY